MWLATVIPLLHLTMAMLAVLFQTKVQEIAGIDKLRYLHNILSFVLPVLKQIYSEQCIEIAVETRVHGICFILWFLWLSSRLYFVFPCNCIKYLFISGMKTDIPRANILADEQMCW